MLHRTTARDVFSDGTIAETSEVVHHEVRRAVDTVLAATSPDARRETLANLLGGCSVALADQTADNLASGVEVVQGAATAMARREAVASLIGEACGLQVLIELAAMEFTEHCTWRQGREAPGVPGHVDEPRRRREDVVPCGVRAGAGRLRRGGCGDRARRPRSAAKHRGSVRRGTRLRGGRASAQRDARRAIGLGRNPRERHNRGGFETSTGAH